MLTPAEELIEVRAAYRRVCAQLTEREQEAHDLRTQNEELLAKNAALLSRIERMTRRLYGASSERCHPGQQTIDLGLPVIVTESESTAMADAELAESAPLASAVVTATPSINHAGPLPDKIRRPRAPGSHPGRRRLPDDAEVVEEDIEVAEHERLDAHGQPLPLLGWKVTDKWDYRRGTYLIRRYRRAIYGQPFSAAADRVVAELPAFLIPRGQMTDAALIHTVVEKFADHLPLYRQVVRAARTGITLSRATLVNHIAAVAGAMAPIVGAIANAVRAAPYIHLDDTPVRLLDPGRGTTATARIWVYRSATASVFRFTQTREGRHPAEFLGDYRGFIVADAYAGHERLYGENKATHIACWAHVRRKFHEIREHYPFAQIVVDDIQRLYRIEADLRDVHPDERQQARQQRSRPLLSALKNRLDRA